MEKALKKIQQEIIHLLKKNGVIKAGFFGSFARGEQKKKSDIDILIQFKGKKSLLSLAKLELDLEKKTGRKVDLLTYNSIHHLIKKRILQDEVRIL